MAGGIGSRFWPFSTKETPKQFLDILGTGRTLIQQTVDRFTEIAPKENIFIVTNKDYKGLINEQLPFISDEQILLEPGRRNTAPCIAYASYKIQKQNPEANIIVSPADHVIVKEGIFKDTLREVLYISEKEDVLVTLGIQPSRPDTGYGYIQVNEESRLGSLYKVKQFTEKPQKEKAIRFLESGDYVWNSGIFIWNVDAITKAFSEHMSNLAIAFNEIADDFYTEREQKAVARVYQDCGSISIDYGIMEKAQNVFVKPCVIGWSDLGTWKSLFDISKKDDANNVLDGDIHVYNTKNSIIKTPQDKLLIVQGLNNFIIAEKDNVMVICNKDDEQRIKEFVSELQEKEIEKV